MTTAQYLAALERLGLSTLGPETQEALDKSWRQLCRYKHGETPIPKLIEWRLAALMERAKC